MAPTRAPAPMATPPTSASSAFTARRRRCATTPDNAATKTWTMVTAATVLTSRRPTPRTGGPKSSSGIMTIAPPTPTSPETKAPLRLSPESTDRKPTVTCPALPQARVVGGHVAERRIGDRLQDGLHLVELGVAGAPLLRLEQQELVAEVDRRLPGDRGDELGRIPLPFGPVAGGALRRGRAAAVDGAAIGADRRRLPPLGGEVGRDLVHAQELHLLGERLHLR